MCDDSFLDAAAARPLADRQARLLVIRLLVVVVVHVVVMPAGLLIGFFFGNVRD